MWVYIKISQYIIVIVTDPSEQSFTHSTLSTFNFKEYQTSLSLPDIAAPVPNLGSAFPPVSFYISASHFDTKLSPEQLVAKINACLNFNNSVSYEFHTYYWACICTDKSTITKFEIRLYS